METGLLCLALGIALLLSVYPLWGVARGDARNDRVFPLFCLAAVYVVAGAFPALVNAFVRSESLLSPYVASNSNTQLPARYCVAATWARMKARDRCWALLMSGWTFAVATFSQRIPLDIVARVLAIRGWASVGFLLFILFTLTHSHARCRTSRLKGRDLAAVPGSWADAHSASLYTGTWVSGGVCFRHCSLLCGALWTALMRVYSSVDVAARIVDALALCWFRMAYYELGWGGWWFLHSGTKCSVMPWLGGDGADALTGGH
ncbi:hypothetical protein ACLK19_14620 [Escherichia coli]